MVHWTLLKIRNEGGGHPAQSRILTPLFSLLSRSSSPSMETSSISSSSISSAMLPFSVLSRPSPLLRGDFWLRLCLLPKSTVKGELCWVAWCRVGLFTNWLHTLHSLFLFVFCMYILYISILVVFFCLKNKNKNCNPLSQMDWLYKKDYIDAGKIMRPLIIRSQTNTSLKDHETTDERISQRSWDHWIKSDEHITQRSHDHWPAHLQRVILTSASGHFFFFLFSVHIPSWPINDLKMHAKL